MKEHNGSSQPSEGCAWQSTGSANHTVRIALLIMASGVALSLFLSWFSPLWQAQTPKEVEQEEMRGTIAGGRESPPPDA